MAKLKKKILSLLTVLVLLAGAFASAGVADIADYTSFPPFLPRVVSPNILFLLDYSKSMVRPAYGECDSTLSDCRTTFDHPVDDYSSTTPYEGYFDNGYDENASSYSDVSAAKYTCTSTGSAVCTKNSSGEWNGNWLNWLTMTQFDIVKKVVIGGDITPSPEGANPQNMKLRSRLVASRPIYKTVDKGSCTANAPDSLCDTSPVTVTYDWKSTPASGVTTHLSGDKDGTFATTDLPFDLKFYGATYNSISIGLDGYISFDTHASYYNNQVNIPNTAQPNNLLAPYWDDSQMKAEAGSSIKSFTLGSSPNRTFVVTFENMVNDDDPKLASPSSAYKPLTYQVLFYEGSNKIVFQYKEVRPAETFGGGKKASIGIENSDGTVYEKYLYFGQAPDGSARTVANSTALLVYRPKRFAILPQSNNPTVFKLDESGSAEYAVNIAISAGTSRNADGTCPSTSPYFNGNQSKCYDHETTGLFHDFRDDESEGVLGFRLGFMRVGLQNTGTDGGEIKTKGKYFNSTDSSNFFTGTRGDTPSEEAPLAEALYEARRYVAQDDPFWTNDYVNSNGDVSACTSSGANYDPYCFKSAATKVPCAKTYVLLVSSGNYSDDNGWDIVTDTEDSGDVALPSDAWASTGETSGEEGTKANGGWLDNVAYKARTTDLRSDLDGTQNITLYAVNTFGEGSGDGTAVLKRAAQYGGYKTSPADEDPVDPRTYFEASGGGNLKSQILLAVTEIIKNSASGTSVSVLSTSAEGTGALYQAYFYPARLEGQSEERRWPGFLRAFFLDRQQNLRDDFSNSTASGTAPTDSRLITAEDRVAHMSLDESTNEVKVKLLRDEDGLLPTNLTDSSYEAIVTMDAVPSIWEGGKKLAQRDKDDRKIYLWVDLDNDGDVDDTDWSATGTTDESKSLANYNSATLVPYLRAADTVYNSVTVKTASAEAAEIIDFVKGNHVNGYRNRCIDIDASSAETGCSSGQRVWPLGDIIYSTPTLVGAPGEKFDQIYGDNTGYRAFSSLYKSRRQVVYTGANDGMLHAFNAGVYKAGDDGSTASKTENGWFTANPETGSGYNSVGIGDELWSFIPYDNLPHLAWLACNGTKFNPSAPSEPFDPAVCGDAEYTHVYYVDHRPKVTDAQIFSDDATHPNGWGTILILPLRMGGGAINVTKNFSNPFDATASDTTRQFRSAYYAFDITDPEIPPKLLWRFSHADLGFSVSYPGIVRVENSSNTVKWFMVVGSGPTNSTTQRDYASSSTTQTGKLFVVDLADGTIATGAGSHTPISLVSLGATNAIMGDPTVVDVDLDFSADVIYIGSAISATSGRVFRINIKKDINPDNWDRTTLFDPDSSHTSDDPDDPINDPVNKYDMGPLLVPPSVSKDIYGNLWVFFGTGRLRNNTDLQNSQQQRFYGIKDGCWKGLSESTCPGANDHTYQLSDLLDASAITVSADTGSSTQVKDTTTGSTICGAGENAANGCTYAKMLEQARLKKGWFFDLLNPASTPSERVLSRGSVLGGLVLFTTYKPLQDMCSILGDSGLYAVYYESGTAYNKKVLPQSDSDTDVAKSYDLGAGMPTSVGVAVGETVSGFVQKSTGEIVRIETAPGLGVRSGAAAWRESSGGGTVEIESIYKHIVK